MLSWIWRILEFQNPKDCIHLPLCCTLPGPLHHHPILPVPHGHHRCPSWIRCMNELRPSSPDPRLHHPSWAGCGSGCCWHHNPSHFGPPLGTAHCRTGAAGLQCFGLAKRGQEVGGALWRIRREIPKELQGFQVYNAGRGMGLRGCTGRMRFWKAKGRRVWWKNTSIIHIWTVSLFLYFAVNDNSKYKRIVFYPWAPWWHLPWSIRRQD